MHTISCTYKCLYFLQARKRAHLVEGLDGTEEPIFGMFRRFFPIDYFMEHMAAVRQAQSGGGATSRHTIPWDKGTFLVFLGVIIQLALNPLPNIEWHWRWPSHLPKIPGRKNMAKVMREIVFKKYWQLMCVPGVHHQIAGEFAVENSNSDTYRGMLEFITKCNETW